MDLSVVMITKNERHRLPRTLDALADLNAEIIAVDWGSHDGTAEYLKSRGVLVYEHPFKNYGAQKNVAMSYATKSWILSLDADEILSEETKVSLRYVLDQDRLGQVVQDGFMINRRSVYLGREIYHGGWYPDWVTRLVRKGRAHFTEPEVHEELRVESGKIGKLSGDVLHYSFLGVADQAVKNMRYAEQGAAEILNRGKRVTLFHVIFKPWGKFLECYFWKLGCLDGRQGFYIAVNAMHSMFVKMASAYEHSRS